MVDTYGRWTEEKDYSTYPKEKWCDLDYVANYIREKKYVSKTPIEELILYIIYYWEEYEQNIENESQSYKPMYDNNMMINIENLAIFVEDNGGLKEFDIYECL